VNPLLPLLALILAGLGLLWFFVPILSGIPWVPSSARRIDRALDLAGLRPGEMLYDLGCGDGRVLIAAARRGARAVGIEVSPLHCLYAWLRTRSAGAGGQVSIRWGDFNRCDLGDADVVYQYGHSRFADRLGRLLERQLRPGARLVSVNVDVPGWQPQAVDREERIFLYRMPPTPGSVAGFLMQAPQPPK